MSIAQSGFINNLPLSVVGEAGRGMWDANWTFFYQDTGDQVLEYFPSREWKGKVFFFFSFVSSSYHLNIHEYYLEHPSWPIVSVISLISTFRLENTQYDASNGVGDDGDFGNSPMSGSPSLWSADRKPTQDDSAGDWQRSTGHCYIPPNLKHPPPPLHWGWTSLFTPSLQMPVLILRFVDPTRSEDITGQLYLKATSDLWSQVCKHTLCKKRLNVEILWGMFKDIYALSGEVLATEWYNYD